MEGFGGGLIIALIDFLMVFVVLGGLGLVIVGLRKFSGFMEEEQIDQQPFEKVGRSAKTEPVKGPASDTAVAGQTDKEIAAILTAIQEFTSLPLGSLTVDSIEPISQETMATLQMAQPTQSTQKKAIIAAITAAIHEFTSLPMGSFQITGIHPVRKVSPWKLAGRLELMRMEAE